MEDLTREEAIGIWSGAFVMPWKWRRGERLVNIKKRERGKEKCQIKGNINKNGERIFHIPGGRWYKRTRVNKKKGERWFCSEVEAMNSGWRRSRQ